MYVTVRRYEGVADSGEATRRVNEGFIQLVSQIPGFVAYYFVDAGAGVIISTSVFQDQASAEGRIRKLQSTSARIWPPCSRTRRRSQLAKWSHTRHGSDLPRRSASAIWRSPFERWVKADDATSHFSSYDRRWLTVSTLVDRRLRS